MSVSKQKITAKIVASYLIIVAFAFGVGYIVFREIESFTTLQKNQITDQQKILKISHLLSLLYENDGVARSAIQSKSWDSFVNYSKKNDSLLQKIDSLKILLSSYKQPHLLDSVKTLLLEKQKNIHALKTLKSQNHYKLYTAIALAKLQNLEASLGRLTLGDFVKDPTKLNPSTKKVLKKYVDYLNENAFKDNRTVSKETLDSIFKASTKVLEDLQTNTNKQQTSLLKKEKKLAENDLLISQQIRKILSKIESDTAQHTQQLSQQYRNAIDKSRKIILLAALAGFVMIVIFSIIILSDFWETQRFRLQLERANTKANMLLKSREHLINMVSHDLRSPLSTVIGYSELLENTLTNTKSIHYANKIKSASAYINRLVEDLLEYSKIESGNITVDKVSFNFKTLLEDTTQSIHEQYSEKPIKLVLEIDDKLEENIVSDPFRIRQLITNLVSNAFKFTDEGVVKISARLNNNDSSKNNELILSVSDTGIGIAKEKQHLIFKEFTQLNNTKITSSGFGLGLAISKKIVAFLEGSLTFKSQAGKGTCFVLALPITLAENNNSKLKGSPLKQPPKTLHAIVIDDDDTLRELIIITLTNIGFKAKGFKSASKVLEKINNLTFDCIVTDIQLPEMNGFRFIELLKKHSGYKAQPVIAITGRKDLDTSHYLDNGFNAVIFKPFTPFELTDLFSNLFINNIPKPIINTFSPNKESPLYDLKDLQSFVGNNQSLKSIISVFIDDTHKNIFLLKKYVADHNVEGINQISHKMLTMFLQINAHTITPVLKELECVNSINNTVLKQKIEFLNNEINKVVVALKKTYSL